MPQLRLTKLQLNELDLRSARQIHAQCFYKRAPEEIDAILSDLVDNLLCNLGFVETADIIRYIKKIKLS